ncbi:uncharacterized protein Bfra_009236 [Botrytis fragariae]|uniref:Uncharacterized protein n=1 Tax=Botrytis fragariae TaxID=1964551 RepID=A0A8H6EFQ5_9HELO|nr:uncharacterized protein Bfra_009236 [Botrytis fragariae]KAF5870689.1 hypothetical protein Bfra_009236 [Botrytis fragariae]
MTRNPNRQRNLNETPRGPKEQRAIVQIDDCFEDYMFPDGPSSTSFHGVNDRHQARATFADRGSDTTSQALPAEPETQVSEEEDQHTDHESDNSDTWSTATLRSDEEPAPKNQHEGQYQSGSPPLSPPPPPFVYPDNAYHHEHHETHRQRFNSNFVPLRQTEEQTFLYVGYEGPSSHRVPRIPERFARRPPHYFLSHYQFYDYDSNLDELLCLKGDSKELDYPWAIACPPERPIVDCDETWERRRSLAIFRTRTRSLDRYMTIENAKDNRIKRQ